MLQLRYVCYSSDTSAKAMARDSPWSTSTVADALASIATEDMVGYVDAVENVLESFERRTEYLEDVPVADTVLVLQALARCRGMAAQLESSLLPG